MSRAKDLAGSLLGRLRDESANFSEGERRFVAQFLADQLYTLLYPPFDEHELREFLEKTWKNGKWKGKKYYEIDESYFDWIARDSSETLNDLRRFFMTPEAERAAAIKFCRRHPTAAYFTPTPPASAPSGRRTADQYARPAAGKPPDIATRLASAVDRAIESVRPVSAAPPSPAPLLLPWPPADPLVMAGLRMPVTPTPATPGPSVPLGNKPPRVPAGGVVGPATTKDPDQWRLADGRKPESAADMLDLHEQERAPVMFDPNQPVEVDEEQAIREFEDSTDEPPGPETGPQIDDLSIPF